MILTEKETEVLVYLRNFSYRVHQIMQGANSPVADLSNEELLSLYNKMDDVIKEEGETRRGLGCFDEMYIVELAGVKEALLKEIKKRRINLMNEENRLKETAVACSLLNPLLNVSLPEEMSDKLTVCRKPEISECMVFDSINDIPDKEYFEHAALKYLKAIPSSTTYYDAKYNIRENMEKVEQYPLLKDVLIHVNPVETVRTGLDLIGAKVTLRYQITVADVLSQLRGKISVLCEVVLADKGDLLELNDSCNNKSGVYFIKYENGKLYGLNQQALCPVVAPISEILSLKLIEPSDGKILNTKEFKYAETF